VAIRAAFLLAFFLVVTLAVRASADSGASSGATDFQRDVERETFKLINEFRDQDGLTPLKWNDDIANIARAHSRDMASGEVDFGHDGFGDRVDQMKALIAGFRGAGENVLFTDQPVEVAPRAVQMWLRSPHHLKNIRGDYNLSGIGVWQAKDGAIYFTQLFLKVEEPGN
jgi:uncharacterized protein YkwD